MPFPFGVCPRQQPVPRRRGPSASSPLLLHAISPGRLGCEHRTKDPTRLRRFRPPGDGSVPPDPPLARLVDQGFFSRRHLPAEAGAATASRLEWGCSGRFPGPPQPPSPFPRRLRGQGWARKSSRVLLPPKRLGHPALRPNDRPTRPQRNPRLRPRLRENPVQAAARSRLACSVCRCQPTSSARLPRVARPRGLAPLTSPESPPHLAVRPGFAPPLGFYSPSKVILPFNPLRLAPALCFAAEGPSPPLARCERPAHQGGLRVPSNRKSPSHSAEPWTFAQLPAPGCPYGPFGVGFRGRIPRGPTLEPPPERDAS